MATKFVRVLNFSTGSTTARMTYFLKIMYEFWGYCIFGGASVGSPGTNAFAATTPTGGALPANFLGVATTIAVASNGAVLPQGTINVASTTEFPASGTIFVKTTTGTQTITYTGVGATTFTGCTGGTGTMTTGDNVTSSSLMTVGTDGATTATTIYRMDGYQDFTAASGPFTASMVGKQLVTWKAGSNSSEDSIYNIIAFKSPTNIVVNVNNGGTPSSGNDGYRPSFTTRSAINYRVIDVAVAGAFTGIADGNFIVFQLDGSIVNPGQANPQLQLFVASTNQRLDFRMSPNGTWNGTAFGVDGSSTILPNLASANSSNSMQNTTSAGQCTITLIGDKEFLIVYGKDSNHASSNGFHFHWEIPERLYSQTQDPNPFAVQINGYGNPSSPNFFNSTGTTYGYGGGFVMRCNDGVFRNHRMSVKALIGDGDTDRLQVSATQLPKVPGNSLVDIRAGANLVTGQLANSTGFLSLVGVVNQYSLARARVKKIRFANSFMKVFTRFNGGSDGDFILLNQGVALPWDKVVLPYTWFPY